MVDKKNRKNWQENDVFALKIQTDDKDLKNRYFILIKKNIENVDGQGWYLFRIKITNNNKLPTTKEEIDKLEYVKTNIFPKKNTNSINDFYLYTYLITIYFGRIKTIPDFQYLGNFELKDPEDEYIPSILDNIPYEIYSDLDVQLQKEYKDFNLKQSFLFTDKGKKNLNQTYDIVLKAKEKFNTKVK